MCGIGTSSMPRRSRCRSKECHCSWLCTSSKISLDAHPLKPNKALYQAQSPRAWSSNAWLPKSLLLSTTSSPRCVGAQPLRLLVPRRCPVEPVEPAESVEPVEPVEPGESVEPAESGLWSFGLWASFQAQTRKCRARDAPHEKHDDSTLLQSRLMFDHVPIPETHRNHHHRT